MNFEENKFRVVSYSVDGSDRSLTEGDIKRFYSDLYNVYKNYAGDLTNGKFKVSDEVKLLFGKYKSGYPDFLLESIFDKSVIKFVEVKLDGDALSPNQVHFNNELAELANVEVAYFNLREKYINAENVISTFKLCKRDKEIMRRCEYFIIAGKKRGFKPLWVVGMLYKDFNKLILDKRIVGIISSRINVPKDKIVWFIKNKLEEEKITKKIKYD